MLINQIGRQVGAKPSWDKQLEKTLFEANLVSAKQIRLANGDKKKLSQQDIAETLVSRGWIERKTIDFFEQKWPIILRQKTRKPIGYYLKEAGLLTQEQIDFILQKQKEKNGFWIKFGQLAVIKGWVKQGTIEFFVESLSEQKPQKTDSFGSLSEKLLERYIEGEINFARLNLNYISLNNAVLKGINFNKTKLKEAEFQNSHLNYCSFKNANLYQSNLEKSSLKQTNFTKACLEEANLQEAYLEEADLSNADLKKANLNHADLINCCLQGADLRGASLSEAYLNGADLRKANLDGANLDGACYDENTCFDRNLNPVNLGMKSIDIKQAKSVIGANRHSLLSPFYMIIQ